MKAEIWVSFNYGGLTIQFSKVIELAFQPFVGLWICEETEGGDQNTIQLNENDYCHTIICYYPRTKMFEVNVRNLWKRPVDDETIDSEIETFTRFGWNRMDSTNIKELKELMARNHARL